MGDLLPALPYPGRKGGLGMSEIANPGSRNTSGVFSLGDLPGMLIGEGGFQGGPQSSGDNWRGADISYTVVWDLVQANNQSKASNGVILCQAYKESRAQGYSMGKGKDRRWYSPPLGTFYGGSRGSVSHRGLMQVDPVAAGLGGLGNGKGLHLTDDQLIKSNINPDYINNIWDPAANIRAGTGYLQYLMDQYHVDAEGALKRFRGDKDPQVNEDYANNIKECADKVDAGDMLGGLKLIN